MHYLLITGCLCISIALLEAWLMVSVRFWNIASIKNLVVGYGFIVKSHVDYLLMSSLLFGIYSVLSHLAVDLSMVFVICICIGAVLNPLGFLVAAFRKQPSKIMTWVTYGSFTVTTIGFFGAIGTILSSVI